MKILITGGTGFLGRATAYRLKDLGHQVSILGRNAKVGLSMQGEGIRFFQTDLTDKGGIDKACQGQEVVIHSAALASPWGKYQIFYEANVIGTKNVVESCLKQNVRRLVNISTPSVYFDFKHRLNIKENDPLPQKQATNYAATKLMADREVLKAFERGLETISIRPRAIFGPGDQTVLGRVLKAAEKGVIPLVNGGESYIDMTYVDNVVDAIVLCMNAPKSALNKVFNITNGDPRRAVELYDLLFSKLRTKIRYKRLPFFAAYGFASALELYYKVFSPDKEPPITRYAVGLVSKSQTLDISLAKKELGYKPKIKLEEGVERFCDWWLSQGNNRPKS